MEVLILIATILAVVYVGASNGIIAGILGAELLVFSLWSGWPVIGTVVAWVLFAGVCFLLFSNPWRQKLVTKPLFEWGKSVMPSISKTEQEALEAGTVGWESHFFSGKPNWQQLLNQASSQLSKEEEAFLDGPVEELCEQLNDWEITHERYDLREETWQFLKDKGFFGMIIPKEHGGLGFSHAAHSEVVMKIATRSISAAVTVMVPNSLGPAELLLQYGEPEQRDYYLPRLAKGEEIPCFALTGPTAGSDAGAIPDKGVVCRQEFKGESTLGVRLNWNKRYITLAPVATVLGLAFKLYDPDHLIGDEESRGVTCALIPTDLPGINTGARHLPLNTVFMNGPTWGHDVFIPLDYLIGGEKHIGNGWTMLMNALSVGRSISLPALATGAGKLSSMTTGAYARFREQFGMPVGEFEGVQEALEQIAGLTYMMDSARKMVLQAVDQGEKPAIPSAMLKYQNTEFMRKVVGHSMDVHAGRGVIKGPRNHIARVYQAIPISITVEGANILTRSMMVFGQGAIRCHPYLLDEMLALNEDDLSKFDHAFFNHMGQGLHSTARALVLGATHGMLSRPPVKGEHARYFGHIDRFAAAYAFCVNITFAVIGGDIKRKERISGRLADGLIYLYYASAVLNRYERSSQSPQEASLMQWGADYALYQLQSALDRFIANFPAAVMRPVLRLICFPLGQRFRLPNDKQGTGVARLLLAPSEIRDELIKGCYRNQNPNDPVGRIEYSFMKWIDADMLKAKVKDAIAREVLDSGLEKLDLFQEDQRETYLREAIKAEVLSQEEADQLESAVMAVWDAIQVDHFDPDELVRNSDPKKSLTAPMDGPEVKA